MFHPFPQFSIYETEVRSTIFPVLYSRLIMYLLVLSTYMSSRYILRMIIKLPIYETEHLHVI